MTIKDQTKQTLQSECLDTTVFIKATQVAKLLKITPKTLKKLEASKQDFPRGWQIGERTRLYDADAVKDWINKNKA